MALSPAHKFERLGKDRKGDAEGNRSGRRVLIAVWAAVYLSNLGERGQ